MTLFAPSGRNKPRKKQSLSSGTIGILDTNILIHALSTDAHGADCRRFLQRVRDGEVAVLLTSVVALEFTYAVGRYAKQMTREDIADYLVSVMSLPSVELEDEILVDTVRLWAKTPDLSFVDAYLGLRAQREDLPVFTKNIRHFERFGIRVPNPLERYVP